MLEKYAQKNFGVSKGEVDRYIEQLKKINFGTLNRKLKKANLTLKGRKFKDLNDLIEYFRFLIIKTLKKLNATDEEIFMFFTLITLRTSNDIDNEATDRKAPRRLI